MDHVLTDLRISKRCVPGRGHTQDGQSTAEALRRSGLFDVPTIDLPDEASLPQHIVDKGYIGLGMVKPKNLRTLRPDDKVYDKTIKPCPLQDRTIHRQHPEPSVSCKPVTKDH